MELSVKSKHKEFYTQHQFKAGCGGSQGSRNVKDSIIEVFEQIKILNPHLELIILPKRTDLALTTKHIIKTNG